MKTSRKLLASAAAGLALVGASIAVSANTTTPKPPKPPKPAKCKTYLPDPAATIAALPAGGTFNGTGHCYLTSGIDAGPHNIIGGTYKDDANTVPVHVHGTAEVGLHPIIEVKQTNGPTTIANVTLIGANTKGGYHGAGFVGQEGISVRSASNVTITNILSDDTFGDCLTVFISATKPQTIPNAVNVNGFTCDNPGRDAFSPAAMTNSIWTNIVAEGKVPDSAFDFEADLHGFSGDTGNQFVNVTAKGGIQIIEQMGTTAFVNTVTGGKFNLDSIGAQISYQGSFVCARRAPGACVTVSNGTLTIAPGPNVFSYVAGTSKADQAWTKVNPPGVLTGP